MSDDVKAAAKKVLTETPKMRPLYPVEAVRVVEALAAANLLADPEALAELRAELDISQRRGDGWREMVKHDLAERDQLRAERDEALRTLDAIRALHDMWWNDADDPDAPATLRAIHKLLDGPARPVPAQPDPPSKENAMLAIDLDPELLDVLPRLIDEFGAAGVKNAVDLLSVPVPAQEAEPACGHVVKHPSYDPCELPGGHSGHHRHRLHPPLDGRASEGRRQNDG